MAIPRRHRFRWRWIHAVRSGKIKPGELLMLEGVGGGFTWGAVLLQM